MTLIYLGLSWLAGIYLASLLVVPNTLPPLVIVAAAIAALRWPKTPVRQGALALIFLMAGYLRYENPRPSPTDAAALAYYNERGLVALRGWVDEEPEVRGRSQRLRLAAEEIKRPEGWQPVRGRALLIVPHYPEYRYADRLEALGQLETPPALEDFSYRDYLARQGLYSIMRYPRLWQVGGGAGYFWLGELYAFKARLRQAMASLLPEPQASLLDGLLLGTRATMPQDLLEALTATGTLHLIAVSGFNITLVAGLFAATTGRFLRRRPRASLLITAAGIGAYTLLVGAGPTVVRAAIMGFLSLLALYYRRPADALTSLVVAGGLMALHNPLVLWDVSFQLSFFATAGLILLVPGLQPRLARLPAWAADSLAVTLAAQTATLPIVALDFGRLSTVALPANLLAVPVVPAIMLWGALAAFAGLLWLPLGQALALVAWLPLTYLISVVELLGWVPYSSLALERFSPVLVWAYYGLLLGAMAGVGGWWRRLPPAALRLGEWLFAKPTIAVLGIIAALIVAALLSQPSPNLRVSFLDVGQGNAVFIRAPGGRQVLLDGGPQGAPVAAALGRRMPFWNRSLDLVILSHPHEDHLAGLVEVLRRYEVKHILEPGIAHPTPTYRRWLELVSEKKIPVTVARAGQRIELGGGARLEVLQAPAEAQESKASERSVVLRLVAGRLAVLLPGDSGREEQWELLAQGAEVASGVLMVPHHGSGQALDPAFLAAVGPQVAVISVGKDNRFGHPAPETLDQLAQAHIQVYRTDQKGTIELETDGLRYRLHTGR